MEKEKISVIVPCYKVETFLPTCIESLMHQTYSNLEIILVDDGSPDRCGEICEQYAKKDKRIRVIHKENGGLSSARNAGIEIATGTYLGFVDSDDYVHEKMYEILYQNLIATKADLSICNYQVTSHQQEDTKRPIINDYFVVDQLQALENLYNSYAVMTVIACNKLYKRSLFREIRYPVGKINEDEAIIHLLLVQCKKIGYTTAQLYYYYQRPTSIMNDYKVENLKVFEYFEERGKYFHEKHLTKLEHYNNYMLCFQAGYHYNRIPKQMENAKEIKKDLKNRIKYYSHLVLCHSENTLFQKLIVIMIRISPKSLKLAKLLRHE